MDLLRKCLLDYKQASAKQDAHVCLTDLSVSVSLRAQSSDSLSTPRAALPTARRAWLLLTFPCFHAAKSSPPFLHMPLDIKALRGVGIDRELIAMTGVDTTSVSREGTAEVD